VTSRGWWYLFVAVLAVVCAVNFVILIGAMGKLNAQAENGNDARKTQCQREPVIQKLAVAAYAVRGELPTQSRITPEELRVFLKNAPACPK
jgi:hypothetical protein